MPYRAPTLTIPPSLRSRRWAVAAVAAVTAVTGAVAGSLSLRRSPMRPMTLVAVTPLVSFPWPDRARAWAVHRAGDGARQVVFGPLRLSIAADQSTEAAPVRFEAAIIASVPVATGWVFVTADGGVARSGSFLGAPQSLGRFPCAFKVARDSVGRAVVIGEDGSLWTTDGSGPLARNRPPGEVRAAAFMDGTHGAAVLRDGRVMLTADGAQTWDRYVLVDDVAWNVSPDQGGVSIETTRGREVFRWEGAGSPGRPGASRPARAQEPADVEARLRSFIHRRYESLPPSGHIARCAPASVSSEPAPLDPPRRYVCRSDRPLRPITLLPLPFQSGVDASDLLSGTEAGPVRGRFWRTRPDTTGETLVRVTWMGVDEVGPFHGSTSPSGRGLSVHWPLAQRGPLRVEALTRRGALVLTRDEPTGPVLAWGTADRPFVRLRDPFVEQAPSGMKSFFVTSPDGGVTVVFSSPLFEPSRDTWSSAYDEHGAQMGVALVIDAGGAVLGRRGFLGDDPNLMMIGRAGAVVGPVVRDNSEPPRWRLLPVGGGTAPLVPSMRWEHIAACGPVRRPGPTLAVAYPPITLERRGVDQESPVVSRADLEVSPDGAVCVRALSLAGHRLTAMAGDRFEGAMRCEPMVPR